MANQPSDEKTSRSATSKTTITFAYSYSRELGANRTRRLSKFTCLHEDGEAGDGPLEEGEAFRCPIRLHIGPGYREAGRIEWQ